MNKQTSLRKATNVSLDSELLKDAKALGVNISRAAEEGVNDAVRKAKGEAWKRENAASLEAWNEWAEVNGLPLEKYRMFNV
ncbi:type II toxin-antitoxin system CcdA family antitoxin [Sulfitobacter sp. SK011]|uniref:type II toxin-antitoxin system CcdA family antitoxin n=1 Tax=Sulfitobacter TaxID=60136 RepID=UPI000E09EA39|nr:type II toxin-antitoxin system CcdA family antitoxin [Sulfitobacter sp. SK011]AXI44539.1 post-segregation antitoxin CcdA [Sulfitobacter sp. SK011]